MLGYVWHVERPDKVSESDLSQGRNEKLQKYADEKGEVLMTR